MLTCNKFIIVIFRWIKNANFKYFLIFISNVVNIGSYKIHKNENFCGRDGVIVILSNF